MSGSIRAADASDILALHALIEGAYRGDSARRGWTSEADLLDGQRTDPEELADILSDPARVMLIAEDAGEAVGCVLVQDRGRGMAYFGMLSVRSDRQSDGLGRRLLTAAEDTARDRFGATRMQMRVIQVRPELIAWYERRGYVPTGATEPFPYDDPRAGVARRRDLDFVVMERGL